MDPILLVRCDAGETFGIAPGALEHAGAPTTVWQAVDGEPRPSLDGIAGVVLFGSSYNVEHADEQRFIADARALTIEAVERGLPYLGICFGAQMLAWSLDAPVVKAPVREVGLRADPPERRGRDRPAARPLRRRRPRLPVAHGHVRPARRAPTALATGDRVPNQAYRVGERAWGVQWHFEIDRAELEQWLDSFEGADGPLETSWGKTAEAVREEADRFQAEHEVKGRAVFARFAALAAAAR